MFNKKFGVIALILCVVLVLGYLAVNTNAISTVLLAIEGAITDGNLVKFKGIHGVGEDTGLSATNVVKCKFDATSAPTVNNDLDEGYTIGSKWCDITNDKSYICLDNSDGAAVWIEITGAGGGAGTYLELTDTPAAYDNDKYAKSTADGVVWDMPAGGGTVTTSGTPEANDIARFTDATTIEGLNYTELKAALDLEIGTDVQAYSANNALTTEKLSAFAATSSSELAGVISDETGSGALVYGTSPNITTPTGIVKGDVGLGNVENLKVKLDATAAPGVSNDNTEGYAVGSRWVDITNDKEYIALDVSTGAAIWIETTGGEGGGYTNLTSFVDQTAWRLFYSNVDGDVIELPLGADGTYLKSNGPAAALTFDTPSGAGDMLKTIYDTDEDSIVDKSETVDDGVGNSSTAADVKDAVTKKHSQNTDTQFDFYNALASDHTWSGDKDTQPVGESVVFGDLLYFDWTDKEWKKSDADSSTTMPGTRIALESKTDGQDCLMLVKGYIRDDSAFEFAGAMVYVSVTTGAMSSTAPTETGDQIQRVGEAKSADILFFNPSIDVGEI